MIHALPTDDFLAAVQDFDHHARLGQRQVQGHLLGRRGAWSADRPWNPLHLHPQAVLLSSDLPLRPVAGRSLVRMGLYPDLGAPESALAVCHDLYDFAHDLAEADDEQGACFAALFKGQAIGSEVHFEHLLWRQLQTMHGVDAQYFNGVDPLSVDASKVEFSFGGRVYVVVGRHQGAGGLPRPSMVFYPVWNAWR